MTLRDQLLHLMDGKGISDRRLSMLATGSTDTVRNIRRGSNPRTDTLEAICGVLDLEIYLGPPQDDPGPEPPAPPEILDALGLAEGASLKGRRRGRSSGGSRRAWRARRCATRSSAP